MDLRGQGRVRQTYCLQLLCLCNPTLDNSCASKSHARGDHPSGCRACRSRCNWPNDRFSRNTCFRCVHSNENIGNHGHPPGIPSEALYASKSHVGRGSGAAATAIGSVSTVQSHSGSVVCTQRWWVVMTPLGKGEARLVATGPMIMLTVTLAAYSRAASSGTSIIAPSNEHAGATG